MVVADATEEVVIIEPHPDPSIHPLKPMISGKSNKNLGEDQDKEEEERRDPPPSCYNENGVLTAEMASFSELKYVYSASEVDGEGADVEIEMQEDVAALPLGPSNYSRLGPPPQTAATAVRITPAVPVVRDPEVLASLVEQLQQRRAQLSSAKASEEPPQADRQAVAKDTAGTAAILMGNKSNNDQNKNLRHRGALQSAIGPMLRMLRNSENL